MELKALLEGISYHIQQGTAQQNVTEVQYDSRKVEAGHLFVCITGFQTDGHQYIPMALQQGAAALLCEREIEGVPKDVAVIVTENTRKALAALSMQLSCT